jgi:hypothetical protein
MLSYLIGAFGVLIVVLIWVAVQRWAVRNSPELPPDCDMLEVSHRCHHCDKRASCAVFTQQENENTPSQD